MSVGETGTIAVKYEFKNGYHIYTSDDVCGLYVASKDPERAFNHVAASIEKLIKLNDGLDSQVAPTRAYHEFVRQLADTREFVRQLADERGTSCAAVVNTSRTFLVAHYA